MFLSHYRRRLSPKRRGSLTLPSQRNYENTLFECCSSQRWLQSGSRGVLALVLPLLACCLVSVVATGLTKMTFLEMWLGDVTDSPATVTLHGSWLNFRPEYAKHIASVFRVQLQHFDTECSPSSRKNSHFKLTPGHLRKHTYSPNDVVSVHQDLNPVSCPTYEFPVCRW